MSPEAFIRLMPEVIAGSDPVCKIPVLDKIADKFRSE